MISQTYSPKLVSIISPCYNGESYINRFLDSLLAQTYDKIELILINDGSTDNTEAIIKSYEVKFSSRGYLFKYIYQDNAGQSEAINKALPIFQGEYMTWVDSDDFLPPDAIKVKVAYLENHLNVGIVVSRVQVVSENNFEYLRIQQRICPEGKDDFFFDLILGKNVYYTPGGYMVRSSMFKDAMPKPIKIQSPREIGQNFQLLLPISYKYPIGYIDDITYIYTVRNNSHSRQKHDYNESMNIIRIISKVLHNIALNIEPNEQYRIKIDNAIDIRIAKSQLRCLLHYNKKDGLNELKNRLKLLNAYDKESEHMIFCLKYPLLSKIIVTGKRKLYSLKRLNIKL